MYSQSDKNLEAKGLHGSYIYFVIHPPLMMAQSRAERTWEITNYEQFINQFLPNIIRSIWQFKRINDKKCLLCSIKYVYISKKLK